MACSLEVQPPIGSTAGSPHDGKQMFHKTIHSGEVALDMSSLAGPRSLAPFAVDNRPHAAEASLPAMSPNRDPLPSPVFGP